jgi:hypothetical protein
MSDDNFIAFDSKRRADTDGAVIRNSLDHAKEAAIRETPAAATSAEANAAPPASADRS